MVVRICSFEAVGQITPGISYEGFRRQVIKAGRFSVFEATANRRAASLFTQLCCDPEVEIDGESVGFPWTIVRERT